VDEVQAKVALVHDEQRVLSEEEAVVSCLLFIQFILRATNGAERYGLHV